MKKRKNKEKEEWKKMAPIAHDILFRLMGSPEISLHRRSRKSQGDQ